MKGISSDVSNRLGVADKLMLPGSPTVMAQ